MLSTLSRRTLLTALALAVHRRTARAEDAPISIGAILSLTGPGASLGIPQRNTFELLPKTIAGRAVRLTILDDATDSSAAVRDVRKLIDEERVDAIIGPTVTPPSLAVLDAIGQAEVPMLSLAGASAIVEPQEGARRWAFKTAPADRLMTTPVAAHMARNGVKSYAVIAFATAFGDGQVAALDASAQPHGLRNAMTVRYNPGDTSVTPQVLRMIAARPGAMFVGASGTPGTTPIIELRNRGWTGPIYGTQGLGNTDVLRVGGKALEGLVFTVTPALVSEQLPDSNAVKAVALAYGQAYEDRFGRGTRSLFGAMVWDSSLLIERAAAAALQAGQPGTPAFRRGLRDGIEGVHGLVGVQGIYDLSHDDHSGSGPSAQVLVTVKNGAWLYLPG